MSHGNWRRYKYIIPALWIQVGIRQCGPTCRHWKLKTALFAVNIEKPRISSATYNKKNSFIVCFISVSFQSLLCFLWLYENWWRTASVKLNATSKTTNIFSNFILFFSNSIISSEEHSSNVELIDCFVQKLIT